MVKAYVFIQVAAGHSRDVVSALLNNPNVVSASRVTGPYDVIAVIQADALNAIHDLITEKIHRLQGVVRTTTSVSVEQQ